MSQNRKQSKSSSTANNTLRIIGGRWRSRKLNFVSAEGLRPTPDRVRETLFNWLQMHMPYSRCLDLFAGSGALGLEALSRGSFEVTFVEKNRAAAQQIKANLELLGSENQVDNTDAESYLATAVDPFDIIFLDPPFRKGLIPKVLSTIIERKLIKDTSRIYLEHESEETYDWSEWGLEVSKETSAGQVKSFLLTVAE